jgi:hypothetical protein
MGLSAREYICWFAVVTEILGKVLHCVQDDGGERMRMRNKEGTIKVKVKVNVNGKPDGAYCHVSAPNS